MSIGRLSFVLFMMMLTLTACGGNQDQTQTSQEKNGEEETPLHIYTTLYPWQEFTERIGQDEVEVENLVPAGSDVHSFEPTAKTMIRVAEGDVFIYNGAGVDGFSQAVKDTAEQEGVTTLEVTENMTLQTQREHSHAEDVEGHHHGDEAEADTDSHAHSDVDPHVWLDPLLAIEAAENIKTALIELRPDKKQYFEENFQQLKSDLEALHENFKQMAASANRDTFLVSHAGYGYWESRYQLHQIGMTGLSPSNEPSQKQLQQIIQLAQDYEVQHVMLEQNISSKIAEVVQDEIGAEALYLHNLESLTEEDIENNENYFRLMEQNINHLAEALQ
ncbi:zinc transport system substrate-binding protein [Alteribacillus persepolensis]|uniref:Zinc transport system substrate-binding protein n=1 Tax=Alteribacillus persepolensis TaxID=568899 RepID=A0A1G8K725_9BACI|nr:zinc ABC transporter substrate-binding protein [Alteribacillus persepolensis]SDI39245.1 zinc transport system substrate-binding protein [Alteribacillus persepolensis]